MAAQSRGSVNVLVHEGEGLVGGDGHAVLLLALGQNLEQQLGAAPVQLHMLGRGRDAVHRFWCRFSRPRPPNPPCELAPQRALHVIRCVRSRRRTLRNRLRFR